MGNSGKLEKAKSVGVQSSVRSGFPEFPIQNLLLNCYSYLWDCILVLACGSFQCSCVSDYRFARYQINPLNYLL